MDHWKQRDKVLATKHSDGLSAHPERNCPDSPWLEWRLQFKDTKGRRRCITLAQWPQTSESEAREMAQSLRAGDARALGRVMLVNGKLGPSESWMLRGMGEDGLKAAIEREKAWLRCISRENHWPRLEKAEARRALNRLESVLGRMRSFAQARGIQLQTAASEARAAA